MAIAGNLDKEIQVKTKDEIGELAEALSQMTGDLKKSRKDIEEYSKGLEEKIKERTKELSGLTENLDEQVKERTKELNQKIGDLERMNKLMINRELKMAELKKEIEELKKLK